MEADWEVEIGGEAPVIDACWEGLVDLRRAPERAAHLPECRELPELGEVLAGLNSAASPLWTSKCDVWIPEDFDADELDAEGEEGNVAWACYLDLLPRDEARWASADHAVAELRAVCSRLKEVCMRCCRVDLVVRRARIVPDRLDVGVTAYVVGCGPAPDAARRRLAAALDALLNATLGGTAGQNGPESYNGRARASSSIG